MNDQTIRITSAHELVILIRELRIANIGNLLVFRGHSLREYTLTPGITRGSIPVEKITEIESKLYSAFFNDLRDNKIPGEKLSQMIADQPELLSWYSTCLGQHLGLKTRLLDWSDRCETSLYFAVEDKSKHGQDGSLWIFRCPAEMIHGQTKYKEFTGTSLPDHNLSGLLSMPLFPNDNTSSIAERRISRQGGKFYTQPAELLKIPMDMQPELKGHLIEIIIDGASKPQIKAELAKFNQNGEFNYYDNPAINSQVKKINDQFWY